jgi:MFS family permease
MQVLSPSLVTRSWTWYLVPMNAGSSGLSTMLSIYILQLGGTVREVAISAFLSGLAVTFGAIFWGKLMDALEWRRVILVISAASMVALGSSVYLVHDVPEVILISVLIAFFTAGAGPVTNLLVMEKSGKENMLKTFSWTSLISCGGLVIAMVAGYLWLMDHDVRSYAALCAVMALSSLVLTILLVKSPLDGKEKKRERRKVSYRSVRCNLKSVSFRTAKPAAFSLSGLRSLLSRKEFLFFFGVALYFLSGNLIYTPYTPFLKENNITDSQVFLAYTILHLSKVVFLPFNSRIVSKREDVMGRWSYLPRMTGAGLMAVAAVFFAGSPFSVLAFTLAAFILVDGIGFSLWSTTTTTALLKMIPDGKGGNMAGTNSSVTGAGQLVGSIMAGGMAASFGYGSSFILGIGFLVVSLVLMTKFFKKKALPTIPKKAPAPLLPATAKVLEVTDN